MKALLYTFIIVLVGTMSIVHGETNHQQCTSDQLQKLIAYAQKYAPAKESVLLAAADRGCRNVVAYLLADPAIDVEYVSESDGQNALMRAARAGHYDIVDMLLSYRATTRHFNINAKDAQGDTALHLATREGHPRVVKLLRDAGANKNIKNTYGQRPIDIIRNMRGYSTENPITYYARRFAAWMQEKTLPEERLPEVYRRIERLLASS